MFDSRAYLEDLKEAVEASKHPLPSDLYQPEYYYSFLKASILKLPEEWDSNVQSLVYDKIHPDLNAIASDLSRDIQTSRHHEDRAQCYQILLRFAIILGANETEYVAEV